jgi:SsrA-binding protein
MEIKNKKANFDYFIEETIECGIELKGTEIKSLRNGSGDLKDTFALIRNGEVFLHNMYIAKYEEGNIFNHDERRTRKLLLHKHEIKKLKEKVDREGYSLVPLKAYLVRNKVKLLLGVGKGKKLYDKREDIAKKDAERRIRQQLSEKR